MARRLMTFYVGRHWCGVDVEAVQEVVTFAGLTPVPLAPAEVAGLANLRGHIMTVLDLRRLLELGEAGAGSPGYGIVLGGGQAVALLADRPGEVAAVADEDFEPPPETLQGSVREKILGAFKLPEGLLLVLNLERLLRVRVERRARPRGTAGS